MSFAKSSHYSGGWQQVVIGDIQLTRTGYLMESGEKGQHPA
ncbi:MAG: hypothetical protein ACM3P1_10885 [Candidatus Saccharibacteria bacterium]